MSLFVVNQEKCKRDGICVAECPFGLIEMQDKDSVPTPVARAEELCINCGHCVAVCPHGAMALTTMAPEQCPPLQKEKLPGPQQVEHLMRARRSIRSFKYNGVEREVLQRLLDIVRFAPTGVNRQQVNWLVINNKEEVRRLAGLVADWLRQQAKEGGALSGASYMSGIVAAWDAGQDRICRDAPVLFVTHAPKGVPLLETDCTIALTYLELAAFSFGLGTCWAGLFNHAAGQWLPLQRALGLPEGHVSFGAMMLGYPKYRYHRLPLRNAARVTWR